MNELERVGASVGNLLLQSSRVAFEEEKIQSAKVRLESMDAIFEGFIDGLECLYYELDPCYSFSVKYTRQLTINGSKNRRSFTP
ncbi:hypothetical protein QQP08_000493 [Theobroma cacao]|uniref:Uncharacterized protein n=1 Tax=Theobroma cacao TaxID=3641 RepID=A0A061DF43_THECC|nr:Uncharacterized protein TCM_000104 [Theobroma cacao]WRX08006.1 hypothetical protein QQP08_000493 [Theobroma cacao]